MDWYQVVKTINGRKYLYLQKTYRVGRSVKTLNKYIGPASTAGASLNTTVWVPADLKSLAIQAKRCKTPEAFIQTLANRIRLAPTPIDSLPARMPVIGSKIRTTFSGDNLLTVEAVVDTIVHARRVGASSPIRVMHDEIVEILGGTQPLKMRPPNAIAAENKYRQELKHHGFSSLRAFFEYIHGTTKDPY